MFPILIDSKLLFYVCMYLCMYVCSMCMPGCVCMSLCNYVVCVCSVSECSYVVCEYANVCSVYMTVYEHIYM